jgi:hypothetical protein
VRACVVLCVCVCMRACLRVEDSQCVAVPSRVPVCAFAWEGACAHADSCGRVHVRCLCVCVRLTLGVRVRVWGVAAQSGLLLACQSVSTPLDRRSRRR